MKQDVARNVAKRQIFKALFADKRAVRRVASLILLESIVNLLIPISFRFVLESQSLVAIMSVSLSMAVQVALLGMFSERCKTLAGILLEQLTLSITVPMRSAFPQALDQIQERHGPIHTSLIQGLVKTYALDYPSAIRNTLIVLSQMVGLCLALDRGYLYLGVSLLGIGLLIYLVNKSTRWFEGFSLELKEIDGKLNNHMRSMGEELVLHQAAGSFATKIENLKQVLRERLQLLLGSEAKRSRLIGMKRALPPLLTMSCAFLVAVFVDRISITDQAAMNNYMHTIVFVSYTAMLVFQRIAENQGVLAHLVELREVRQRSQGPVKLGQIEGIRLRIEKFSFPDGTPYYPNGIFLEIKAGEQVVLTGSKGCGKSQIALILARLSEPGFPADWTGTYQVKSGGRWHDVYETDLSTFDQQVFNLSQENTLASGMVEEEGERYRAGSVRDNMSLYLHRDGIDPAEKEELIQDVAWAMLLTDKLEQMGGLSGGETKLCVLGRSLVGAAIYGSGWFIADELFSPLSPEEVVQVMKNIKSLQNKYHFQLTWIIISHSPWLDPNEATAYVFADNGRIIETGNVGELKQQADSAYRRLYPDVA